MTLSYRAAFWLIMAGLLVGSCNPAPPTSPTNIYVNQGQVVGGSTTGGTGSTACGASDPMPTSVVVTTLDGNSQISIAAGAVVLNATPKPLASDACNESRGVTWNVATPATCHLVGSTTTFTPKVLGDASGQSCTVTATILNVVGGIVLPVVP